MGKKAPNPTPPTETAAAQTGTNVSTAIANAMLNNANEITPDGNKTYDITGNYSWHDDYTGKDYTIPTFTVNTTYSPEQQAIKDQQDAAKLNLSTLANNQSGFLNEYMSEPWSYDETGHTNWANGLYDKLNAGSEATARDAMATQLSNQGIKIGTPAYQKAMESLLRSQSDAKTAFELNSYNTGLAASQAQRNQPINEITALMSGSQVSQPNWSGMTSSQIPTTDVANIIGNYDQQRAAAAQANSAALGGLFSGIGSLFALSDKRAKKDIDKVGKLDNGLNIYQFHYKGEDRDAPKHTGLMAQEVKKKKPSAVKTMPSGLMAVNYQKAVKGV